MHLSILEWPVRKQLAAETDTVHRVRIKVLSYALHLRIITNMVFLTIYSTSGFHTQAIRLAVVSVISAGLYIALSFGLAWRRAIHIGILIFLGFIWTDLFVLDHQPSVATFQYAAMVSICAFYGLGTRWGTLYSLLAWLVFALFGISGNPIGPEIPLGPPGASTFAAVLLLVQDFAFLILVHYYFFNAFDETIRTLDARSTELSGHLVKYEAENKKQEEEYVHQKHLLASISHDIKSPLRFLMITTERLAKSHPDLPTVRAISQSSYRLYNFMKNLLEYTEFRYKNADVNFALLDVHELVEQRLEMFGVQADSNLVSLVNNVNKGMILRSNVQLVGIILHNLIDNAIKVTYDGSIIVSAEDHRNELHVIVSDHGRGMEQGIMNWINSDERVPGPEHNPQSFGMGLLIVKEISKLINARLHAEPFKPVGTAVRIIFPKKKMGG